MLTLMAAVLFTVPTTEAGTIAWYWREPESDPGEDNPGEESGSKSSIQKSSVVEQRAPEWVPTPVADDPLVRMPGTQPEQNVQLEGPGGCGCQE